MSENTKQNYLNHPKGIMSWLLTLDHKRIGLMYLFSGILFFFLGGLLALVMRFELAAPGNDIICLLYTSPSPRDLWISRMPSSA